MYVCTCIRTYRDIYIMESIIIYLTSHKSVRFNIIPDFGVSTAILNITGFSRRWCKLNFGPFRGHFKSCHFSKGIEERRQYFYFFIQISWHIWQKRTWIKLLDNDLGYYYLLNGIRLDLGLDNAFWMRKYLTLLQTTFTFHFSHTKQSLT